MQIRYSQYKYGGALVQFFLRATPSRAHGRPELLPDTSLADNAQPNMTVDLAY